jgi:hypothetical protein
MIRV